MRGWLTTVAIGISFEPMNQRPYWMPEPNNHDYSLWRNPHLTSAASWGFYYVCLNTVTFSISLVAVVMLVLPDATSPTDTLRTARVMMVFRAVSVAVNYSFMISKDTVVLLLVMLIINYSSVNIYKEHNRRVFESIQKSVYQVALPVKEEIDLYKLTFRGEVPDQGSDQASQQQLNS
jgi:hypothetical protein